MTANLAFRLALPALGTLLLAVLVMSARAQSPAGSVELLAVDTDTAGNTPTSVGNVEVCSAIDVGEERTIDVVVKGIPELLEGNPNTGTLAGIQFTLLFDERYLHVTAVDFDGQLLGTDPQSNVVDLGDTPPSEDGTIRVAVADFGSDAEESGDGVLARFTVRGVGAGTSDLVFVEQTVLPDVANNAYAIDTVQNALLAVGVECDENATPPPTLPPTNTPGPTTGDGDGEDTPAPGETDGGQSPGQTGGTSGTGSPGASDGPDSTPGDGTDEEGDDGTSWALPVAIAVVAILVLAAGGVYFFLRRQETPPL
ncbi:MAG: cohesin domain-containing protein [Dehalococcoidia bacterium]